MNAERMELGRETLESYKEARAEDEEVQQDPLQLTEEEAGIARSGMPARHEEAGPPYDVEISTSRIEEVPRE
jgi:hypothetical protein